MNTVSNSVLPEQAMFRVLFWDDDWKELYGPSFFTNDSLKIRQVYERLRLTRWEEAHSMNITYFDYIGVLAITVEVML